jgi:hypothetical protein
MVSSRTIERPKGALTVGSARAVACSALAAVGRARGRGDALAAEGSNEAGLNGHGRLSGDGDEDEGEGGGELHDWRGGGFVCDRVVGGWMVKMRPSPGAFIPMRVYPSRLAEQTPHFAWRTCHPVGFTSPPSFSVAICHKEVQLHATTSPRENRPTFFN